MKFILLILLLSVVGHAGTYTVSHRGHPYVFRTGEELSLHSKRFDMTMKEGPCGQMLRQDIQKKFLSSLTHQVKKPASPDGFIRVKSEDTDLYVAESSKNGRQLQNFPDLFAKAVMMQKELCQLKNKTKK